MRRKMHRFDHNRLADNVIERGKDLYTQIKGNWQSYFKNKNPLVLELACGKGEYTVGLARQFPDTNFIGIDIKGDRIARGSKKAIESNLSNVAFLRTSIQFLHEFFNDNEISEIWLIHPDPQPRDKEEKRRLTNKIFIAEYQRILKTDGLFHLKTDSPFLYSYTLDVINDEPHLDLLAHTDNLYQSTLLAEHHGIRTHYEHIWVERGYTIHYIKAKLLAKLA